VKKNDGGLATQRLLEVIRGRGGMDGAPADTSQIPDAVVSPTPAVVPTADGPFLTRARKSKSLLPGRVKVGLDVGHHWVKMVRLERTARSIRLLQMGMAEVVPRDPSPEARLDAQVDAARGLLRDVQPRRDLLVTSLSDTGIIIRQATLPRMPAKDLAQAIPFEARKHVPYESSQVVLRHQVVGEDPKTATCQVLVVAVPRAAFQRHESLLKRLGVQPYAIEVGALAVANAYLAVTRGNPDCVAIVDLGATRTVIDIQRDGGIFFCRQLPISGETFTQEIQRAFGVPYESAERVKRGKSGPGDPDIQAVMEAVRPAVDGLLMEVRRSLAYYDNMAGRRGFSRILLTGGGALLPGLGAYLQENLGLPVELMNPLAGLQWDPGDLGGGWIERALPFLGVAVGLATRR
jgi:type IV pilus assembly protein PilM